MDEIPTKKLKITRTTQLATNLYDHRDETGDVTFIVQSEQIRAHRYVLAALSDKYKAQFYGPQPDQGDIQVNGVTAAAFEEFLKLFYFDDVELSIEHIGDVLDLAKQSLVDEIINECIDFLKQKMTIDNLCSIFRLVNLHDIKELKNVCEQKISTDTKALFDTDDFLHCDRETLENILKLDTLNCAEGEVFDACIDWALAVCEEKHMDRSQLTVNLRTALGDAITQVRFGSMSLNEFVTRYKSLEGFFKPDEYVEITYIIAKLDGFQSQKFNQMRRYQTHGFLECNRIGEQLELPKEHVGYEGLLFRCEKPIYLQGFVIDADAINEIDVEIGEFRTYTEDRRIKIKKLANETMVIFVEPFFVIPTLLYLLRLKYADLKGHTIHQNYPNGAVESDDTAFLFGNRNMYSLVSRLLFTHD